MISQTPAKQYVYGNTEQGTALTIDVFPDGENRFQARIWNDGDTTALEYFENFSNCVKWFGCFDAEQYHDCDVPPKSDALAPQISEHRGYAWIMISCGRAEREIWWDGEKPEGSPDIILFEEMLPEIN